MPNIVKCDCGIELTISDPKVEIVNNLTFAAVVINFDACTGRICPRCGSNHILGIQAIDMKGIRTIFVAVPKQEEPSGLILPPGLRSN